jgi:hypothetical protein
MWEAAGPPFRRNPQGTLVKRILILVLAACAVVLLAPSMASASNCGGWSTGNLDDEWAEVSNVVPMDGMNCASSRYVANKWLKPAYKRQFANRIPTHFYDGYVTWHCRRTSFYGWRCDEYTSNTAFKFNAVYYG